MTFQVSDTSARRSRKHVHLTRQPPLAVLRPPGRGRVALRVVHKGVVRRRAPGRRLRPLLVEGVRGVLGDGGGERCAGHAALVRLVAYARVDNCRLSLDDGGRAGEDRVEVICARALRWYDRARVHAATKTALLHHSVFQIASRRWVQWVKSLDTACPQSGPLPVSGLPSEPFCAM